MDRVDTTSTVWLGLTMACARCHDHKYDPLTQKEYYQTFAYFNNVPERGRAFKYGNSPPIVKAPTPEQQEKLTALDAKIAGQQKEFDAARARIEEAQQAWEKSICNSNLDWASESGLVARFAMEGNTPDAAIKPKEGELRFVPGHSGEALSFDGTLGVDVGDVAKFGFHDKFTLTSWIKPTAAHGVILGRAQDTPEGMKGYAVILKDGKVQVNLVARWLDDSLRSKRGTRLR